MMVCKQDEQVKRGGRITKDSTYQRWLNEASFWNPPYINENPDYRGGMSSHPPKQMVYGSGNPSKD